MCLQRIALKFLHIIRIEDFKHSGAHSNKFLGKAFCKDLPELCDITFRKDDSAHNVAAVYSLVEEDVLVSTVQRNNFVNFLYCLVNTEVQGNKREDAFHDSDLHAHINSERHFRRQEKHVK